MGIAAGLKLGAEAKRRLSEEEKYKIYAEIAKMDAETKLDAAETLIKAREAQIKESEAGAQLKAAQLIEQQRKNSQTLIDMEKNERLIKGRAAQFRNIKDFRMAGSGNVDLGLFFGDYLSKNAQYMESKDVQYYVNKIQEAEQGNEWKPKTKEDWREKYIFEQKHKRFAPSESEKPPSEAQARSKIAALTASRERFKKTDKIDLLAQKLFPELKIASQTGDQKAVDKAYDEAINYYRQFTGPNSNKRKLAIEELEEQGMPITDENIEYAIELME